MRNPAVRCTIPVAELPRISIVTPCLNQAAYIEATLLSILEQGYPRLEYIVLDGGSTDGSAEIIARYAEYLAHWESGLDGGQYWAIQRGLERSSGEIMLWLNADDMLHRNALWTLAAIFSDLPQVEWVMGRPMLYDESGHALWWHGRSRWSRVRCLHGDYRFIQQESVAWRRSLWDRAGGHIDTSYRLAADFELWMRFFRHAALHTADVLIGGFRRLPMQRSRVHFDEYLREAEAIIAREPRTAADDAALRRLRRLDRLRRIPLVGRTWRLRHARDQALGLPPVISYNPQTHRFELREGES